MSEACTELDARLETLANAAALLGSRLPRVRDPAIGRWLAHAMDVLLRNLSSGCGALDVALGEGLDALTVGRRAMDLRYSNIGDYAREELGINASTAVKMARLARRLRERPALREAVRRGEVTARKAEISNPSRNCWSRKAANGLASPRSNRSRRNSSAGRSIPGASTRS